MWLATGRVVMPMISPMYTFSRHDLTDLFRCLAERMAAEQAYLADLDGEIGDADHGVAMSGGFAAAAKALSDTDAKDQTMAEGFTLAASSLLNAVGATTGPLYASALLCTAQTYGPVKQVPAQRMPELVISMADGIAARGHGKQGDKTMVDAWAPAAHAARAGLQSTHAPHDILRQAANAAADGAEATRAMMASKGRAARLGPRSIGHLDPGAVSAAAILDSLALWSASPKNRGNNATK